MPAYVLLYQYMNTSVPKPALMAYCSLDLKASRLVCGNAADMPALVCATLKDIGVSDEIVREVEHRLALPDAMFETKYECDEPQRVRMYLSQYQEMIAGRIQASIEGKEKLWAKH